MKHHLPAHVWTRLFRGLEARGLPPERVRAALDLPASTFYRKWGQHRDGGVLPRRAGTGRERVFLPGDLRPMVRQVLRELPPVAGHRRVRIRLRKRGVALSASTAYRVCRDLGLLLPRERLRGRRRRVEMIRVEGPNLAWVVDTTEWRLAGGEKVYVYLGVDAFSRYCPDLMAATSEDAFHTVRFYERAFRGGRARGRPHGRGEGVRQPRRPGLPAGARGALPRGPAAHAEGPGLRGALRADAEGGVARVQGPEFDQAAADVSRRVPNVVRPGAGTFKPGLPGAGGGAPCLGRPSLLPFSEKQYTPK